MQTTPSTGSAKLSRRLQNTMVLSFPTKLAVQFSAGWPSAVQVTSFGR
ncbi:MAG TPA: hypothetical protein VL285_05365 [Bryobacteraceae bacterium]|nr:hypothetical protein [Bryobacteraceae bacterium]